MLCITHRLMAPVDHSHNSRMNSGDKHGICPPMKSSLFRVFMIRHVLGYAPEASVLRFPSSWLGRNH
jgi:hypothetical protein